MPSSSTPSTNTLAQGFELICTVTGNVMFALVISLLLMT